MCYYPEFSINQIEILQVFENNDPNKSRFYKVSLSGQKGDKSLIFVKLPLGMYVPLDSLTFT
jgi:hypothetical protein